MKFTYLNKFIVVYCFCFLGYLSVSAQVIISPTVTPITCNGLNNGRININVTGGTGPYTFAWSNGSLSAGTVGLNPVKDNTLYSFDGNNSNGAGEQFRVGRSGQGHNLRAVLAFELQGVLPTNVNLTSVNLKLSLSGSSGTSGSQTMNLHRLINDWGEGTSFSPMQSGFGEPATPNDATWTYNFYSSSFWNTPGGDFVSTVSASTVVTNPAPYNWSSAGLLNDVQYWISHPDSNFGWILKGLENGLTQAKRFDSRENSIPAQRPLLTLNYTSPTIISTNQNLVNLPPATYTVIVTDANGITATSIITIAQPAPLALSFSPINATCLQANGRVTGNPSGGRMPYSYLWANGQTTQTAIGLFPGTYFLTVTDSSGCKITRSRGIGNNGVPTQSFTTINACYSYFWNGVTYTESDTYTYTTLNSQGCDSTAFLFLEIENCPISLNVELNIQGLYNSSGLTPLLFNQGLSTNSAAVDSITVSLYNSSAPYNLFKTQKALLTSNGIASMQLNGVVPGNNYYIGIHHQNSIETWSKNPVNFQLLTNYSFK